MRKEPCRSEISRHAGTRALRHVRVWGSQPAPGFWKESVVVGPFNKRGPSTLKIGHGTPKVGPGILTPAIPAMVRQSRGTAAFSLRPLAPGLELVAVPRAAPPAAGGGGRPVLPASPAPRALGPAPRQRALGEEQHRRARRHRWAARVWCARHQICTSAPAKPGGCAPLVPGAPLSPKHAVLRRVPAALAVPPRVQQLQAPLPCVHQEFRPGFPGRSPTSTSAGSRGTCRPRRSCSCGRRR